MQQSSVTCGAACLTVARMLVDTPFARWVMTGDGHPVPGADGSTVSERFASYERTVHRRTNGLRLRAGTLRPPWPRALGTPPWGAKAELENGASWVGTQYEYAMLRHLDQAGRADAYATLVERVVEGEPALLYVGNASLPRHVTLVLPGDGDGRLDVYDPGAGTVHVVDATPFATSQMGLSGWDVPWLLIQPTGHRRIRGRSAALEGIHLPRLAREPVAEPLQRR